MATINVYQTDDHGFYLYETVAYEFPLAPGTYNIPYGAYTDAPPEVAAGMVARRVDDEWVVVEDHRKDVLYVVASGQQYTIGSIVEVDGADQSYDGGGPVPTWLTDVAPVQDEQPA
jgi:hypothetical protein